jgi:hypothetical protein
MRSQRKIQHFQDNDISIIDLFLFLRSNRKSILYFIIFFGGIGFIHGKFISPVYEGKSLISPAKILDAYVDKPEDLIEKINSSNFFDKSKNYNCEAVNIKLTQSKKYLELSYKSKNTTDIIQCIENYENNIKNFQKKIYDARIENTKLELAQLISEKNLNKSFGLFIPKIIEVDSINEKETINMLSYIYASERINKIKNNLNDSLLTHESEKIFPISLQKKSNASVIVGIILGLLIGLAYAIRMEIIKKEKN